MAVRVRRNGDIYAGVQSTKAFRSLSAHLADCPFLVIAPDVGGTTDNEGMYYSRVARRPSGDVHGVQFHTHLGDPTYPDGVIFGFKTKAAAETYAKAVGQSVLSATSSAKQDQRVADISYAFWFYDRNGGSDRDALAMIQERIPDATPTEIAKARLLFAYSKSQGLGTPGVSTVQWARDAGVALNNSGRRPLR